MIMSLKQKKIKFKSRKILNHNIYMAKYLQLKYAASIPKKSRFARTGAASLGNDDVSIVHAHSKKWLGRRKQKMPGTD